MTETTLKTGRVWPDNIKMDLKDIEGKKGFVWFRIRKNGGLL